MHYAAFRNVLFCAIVLAAGCERSQVDVTAETAAVRARSEALVAAEAAWDAERAITFWAEDAIILFNDGPPVRGRAAVLELYHALFQDTGLKEFVGTTSHLKVSRGGDLAYEYGVNRLVYEGATADVVELSKYLAVWEKSNGDWYVVALSVTGDAKDDGTDAASE